MPSEKVENLEGGGARGLKKLKTHSNGGLASGLKRLKIQKGWWIASGWKKLKVQSHGGDRQWLEKVENLEGLVDSQWLEKVKHASMHLYYNFQSCTNIYCCVHTDLQYDTQNSTQFYTHACKISLCASKKKLYPFIQYYANSSVNIYLFQSCYFSWYISNYEKLMRQL